MKKMIVSLSAIALVVALAIPAMAADWKDAPANGTTKTIADGITIWGDNQVNRDKVAILTIEENAAPGTLSIRWNDQGNTTIDTFVIPDDAPVTKDYATPRGAIEYKWEPVTCQCDAGIHCSWDWFEGMTKEDGFAYKAATCSTGETWATAGFICDCCGEVWTWFTGYGEDALGHDFDSFVWDGWGWWASGCSRCDWEGYISYDPNFFKSAGEIAADTLKALSPNDIVTGLSNKGGVLVLTLADDTEFVLGGANGNSLNGSGTVDLGDGWFLDYNFTGNGTKVDLWNVYEG